MAGGFAPINDLLKKDVYTLCKFLNKKFSLIPKRILTKAPTAELKNNQKDSDTLGNYKDLDFVLEKLLREEKPLQDLENISDKNYVQKIAKLIQKSKYKRQQAPKGVFLF